MKSPIWRARSSASIPIRTAASRRGRANSSSRAGRTSTHELLTDITHAIKRQFTYWRRHDPGVQSPLETLQLGTGTCRDFALFMIEAVRSLGFAARFVSGYLHVRARSGRVGGGNTHAWVQVYLPSAGWVEFDPTNGIVGNHDLIRVAVARKPRARRCRYTEPTPASVRDSIGMKVDIDVIAQA